MIIPARLYSRRVPGKALVSLGGLPLIEHVRRRAVRAEVGPVFVATDSSQISSIVEGFGGAVIRTGPAENGTRRVAEAARTLGVRAVLNVQGDQPLLEPAHIQVLAQQMHTAAIATLACSWPETEWREDPARVKVQIEGELAIDFSRTKYTDTGLLHIGMYGFRTEVLHRVTSLPVSARARTERLEQLTWLEAGWTIGVEEVSQSATSVDTLEQLEQVKKTLGE